MPATVDDLVRMNGVIMAFEFTPDGRCTTHKDVSPEMAAMASRFCATVTMQFNTLAAAFTTLSQQQWTPQRGWMYQGGDYAVIAGDGGYRVVFVETAKADLPALLEMLFGSTEHASR